MRGLAPVTVSVYLRCGRQFIESVGKSRRGDSVNAQMRPHRAPTQSTPRAAKVTKRSPYWKPFFLTVMPALVQKPQDAPANNASAPGSPRKCHLNQAIKPS